jgi:hypothetical protein
MKTVLFSVNTPLGEFWIQPQPAGRVLLSIGNRELRTYGNPTLAAEAVAKGETGHQPWDTAEDILRPRSLRQWKKGPRSRKAKELSRTTRLTADQLEG